MKNKNILALVLGAMLCVQAEAATYIGHATATVGYLENSSGLVNGAQIGDTMTFDYWFESTTADQFPGDPTIGSYFGQVSKVTMTAGTFSLTYQPGFQNFINVRDGFHVMPDDMYQDSFETQADSEKVVGVQSTMFMRLADPLRAAQPGGALSSDALLLTAVTPASFLGQKTLEMSRQLFSGDTFIDLDRFGGVVTSWSIEPAPVPLPAAAWLMVSGLAALAGLSRRRRLSAG